jgi:hypothetical protein
MLKEFAQYLADRNRPTHVDINGTTYVTSEDGTVWKSLERFDFDESKAVLPKGFGVSTLTSIIDYITHNPDGFFADGITPIIHIQSPTQVSLRANMTTHGERPLLIESTIEPPRIQFGNQIDIETFIITLQSKFADTDDKKAVLSFVSKLTDESSKTIEDNGISQKTVVKTGVADVGQVTVPNPLVLAPFRTFVEVEQPRSYYLFRLHKEGRVALYEADGGEWKNIAIQSIKAWFEAKLSHMDNLVILA